MTITRVEAIKTLQELWRETNDQWYEETYAMAIEALSQPIVCKNPCVDDDHIYCSPKTADIVVKALSERTGEWVMKEHLWECDQCGCRINRANPLKGNIWNYYFCPNCGARMYKGGEDE